MLSKRLNVGWLQKRLDPWRAALTGCCENCGRIDGRECCNSISLLSARTSLRSVTKCCVQVKIDAARAFAYAISPSFIVVLLKTAPILQIVRFSRCSPVFMGQHCFRATRLMGLLTDADAAEYGNVFSGTVATTLKSQPYQVCRRCFCISHVAALPIQSILCSTTFDILQ